MDKEIFFDNKKFLSSKAAGLLYGYTHDYISRMARQGKIEGRQFGRAWYVDEDSLADFVKVNTEEIFKKRKELRETRKTEYKTANGAVRSPIRLEELAGRAATILSAAILVFGGYFFIQSPLAYSAFSEAQERVAHIQNTLSAIAGVVTSSPAVAAGASAEVHSVVDTPLSNVARTVYFFPRSLRDGLVALPEESRAVVKSFGAYANSVARNVFTSPLLNSPVETLLSSVEHGLAEYYALLKNIGSGIASAPQSTYTLLKYAGETVYGTGQHAVSVFGDTLEMTTPYVSSGLAYSGGIVATAFDSSSELSAIAVTAPQTLMERIAQNTRLAIARWIGLTPAFVATNQEESTPQETTIVNNPTYLTQEITQPVIERVTERIVTERGVSAAELNERLNHLENKLTSAIYAISGADESNTIRTIYQSISHTNKIDQLTNVSLTNATVSGLTGLTDSDIPNDITVSGYLTSSTGVVTVAQGGTGTTTPSGLLYGDGAGTLSATTTIAQNVGGTGISSYTAGDILYADTSGTLATLGIGTNNQVLKVQGGTLAWGAAAGGGGSGLWATTTDELITYPA
ncbi:hypothetical protein COU17_01175, partial [Candidatus Kaiserbacteria bacterium CG10_big_fil_rev_8_21_14_0_10_49_17]